METAHEPSSTIHGASSLGASPVAAAAASGGSAKLSELGQMIADANVTKGKQVARQCVACHSFEQGGGNGQGPKLWDVVGREAGSVDGFKYSGAMQEFGEPWTYANLNAYLESPKGFISGTAMSFAGLRKAEDRANLLAYLQTLSDSPTPFPAAAAPE